MGLITDQKDKQIEIKYNLSDKGAEIRDLKNHIEETNDFLEWLVDEYINDGSTQPELWNEYQKYLDTNNNKD